jgi:hypothetical protein
MGKYLEGILVDGVACSKRDFTASLKKGARLTMNYREATVVSGRLNVVKGLKRTNQIVSFRRS